MNLVGISLSQRRGASFWPWLVLAAFLLDSQTWLFAQAPPPAKFPTGAAAPGQVVIEDEYRFIVRRYEPSVRVTTVTKATASYATPEDAAIAQISAMLAGDFGWFVETWDPQSAQLMAARDKAQNQDASFWTQTWQRSLAGKRAELVARVDSGPYVVIEYRMVGVAAGGSQESFDLTTVVKLHEGRWRNTQDLSQDPVLLYWRDPAKPRRRVVR